MLILMPMLMMMILTATNLSNVCIIIYQDVWPTFYGLNNTFSQYTNTLKFRNSPITAHWNQETWWRKTSNNVFCRGNSGTTTDESRLACTTVPVFPLLTSSSFTVYPSIQQTDHTPPPPWPTVSPSRPLFLHHTPPPSCKSPTPSQPNTISLIHFQGWLGPPVHHAQQLWLPTECEYKMTPRAHTCSHSTFNRMMYTCTSSSLSGRSEDREVMWVSPATLSLSAA